MAAFRLLRWWLRRLAEDSRRFLTLWKSEPEWPLLAVGIPFFLSFLLHWLGFRLALHGFTVPFSSSQEPLFQPPSWEGRVGWRKPLVFGISNAMVACSLKEAIRCQGLFSRKLLSHLAAWPTAVEVAAITVQAWRGHASHFNNATPVDACLYTVKLCGVCLLGAACVAATLGVLMKPMAAGVKAVALHHGMLLLCVSVAVGVGQVIYGHFGLGGPREDEEDLCRWATAGTSGSPCYEIHGHAIVKLAHFLPLHATEVLLLLAWSASQPSKPLMPRMVRLAAAGFWGLALLGILQVLRGAELSRGAELTQRFPLTVLVLSMACIISAFLAAFVAPWPLDDAVPALAAVKTATTTCRSRSSRHAMVEAS
mmetsp:Transcript_52138/g.93473  ORF Transcript_52138/g.93473 Transcript_52138/m.93473 type:complete len:367 (-) Transcript_52138:170-1270(-)